MRGGQRNTILGQLGGYESLCFGRTPHVFCIRNAEIFALFVKMLVMDGPFIVYSELSKHSVYSGLSKIA